MAPDLSRLLPPPSPRVAKATVGPPVSGQETMMVQTSTAASKPRQLLRLPPVSRGGSSDADRRKHATAAAAVSAVPAERAAKAWMRQALAKRVATRMLERSTTSPPAPADERSRQNVLACCCTRLPPGLRCALHQAGTPGWSWMRAQHGVAVGVSGGAGEAVAPPCGRGSGWAFSEYARWRRHVWMPSRFYLERVQEDQAM